MTHVHSFDLGDYVTVFQMSPTRGLMIEGRASIVAIVEDMDEYYEVRFDNDLADYDSADDCPTYVRFVDKEGQDNPAAYALAVNKRIGKA